ncbi:MAG TPA: LysR family transcriptional regulator [Streptosporangiaceae bacterium]
MELRHLTTFRAVAKSLSFTRAAAELGYVQSALTAHVKALEDELGVRLFDRLGRRIVLTDSGVRLLGYAENILELAHEATVVAGQSGQPKGPVTISAPEVLCTYRLPAVIRHLHQQHPGVQLLFRTTTTGALDADLKRALTCGEIDVAFVLEDAIEPTTSLLVKELTDEPLAIIAAPDHPLADAPGVGATDLDGIPVLLTDKGCGYRRVFERVLRQAGVQPTIAGEFTSGETVKRCVQAGTAIGVLATVSVQDELADGRLATLAWTGPQLRLRSYLVSHKNRWVSPAAAALRDATEQAYATPHNARAGLF